MKFVGMSLAEVAAAVATFERQSQLLRGAFVDDVKPIGMAE